MRRVKLLGFDVFGTVVDWRSSVAREAGEFFMRHGRADIDAWQFADAWRRRYQPSMEACRSGARAFTPLDVLHRESLLDTLSEHGFPPDIVTREEVDDLNRVWERLDPWPDAVAGLLRLKARYMLATLSNGNIAMMVMMARRGGLPWDVVLGAEPAQAYKPQPEVYLKAAEIMRVRPEEVCMVAAHNADLHAARQCGLATAFVPRRTEHGLRQTTDLTAEGSWDVVAEDFRELAVMLSA